MSYSDILDNLSAPRGPSLIVQRHYSTTYVLLALLFILTLFTAIQQGSINSWSNIDWVDVAGEGLVLMASFYWLHMVSFWRPPGPVTAWLSSGFFLLTFGFYLDFIDELFIYSDTLWESSLESIVTPIAFFVLTYSASLLRNEQRILHRQQLRREAHYRNHQAIDKITDLYNATYCTQTLNSAITNNHPISLWMIDLDNFDAINKHFGFATGDKILNRVAHTLVASVPDSSLVCRYAGDRFVVLTPQFKMLPTLGSTLGNLLTHAITLALFNETEKTLNTAVHVINITPNPGESAPQMLARANICIEKLKKSGNE